jgi:hypothetical protein
MATPTKARKTIAPRAARGLKAQNAFDAAAANLANAMPVSSRANANGGNANRDNANGGISNGGNTNGGNTNGRAAVTALAERPMTGNDYRDLIASYIHHNYAPHGLVVYVEISLGKTVIGKDRYIDVFVVRPEDRKAVAIECKYQDSLGTVDEKIPYALLDLEALWVPGCLVYAGKGWSRGVLHSLEASRLAAYCLPDGATLARGKLTRELDHMLAAIFGVWELVLPANKRFRPPAR